MIFFDDKEYGFDIYQHTFIVELDVSAGMTFIAMFISMELPFKDGDFP